MSRTSRILSTWLLYAVMWKTHSGVSWMQVMFTGTRSSDTCCHLTCPDPPAETWKTSAHNLQTKSHLLIFTYTQLHFQFTLTSDRLAVVKSAMASLRSDRLCALAGHMSSSICYPSHSWRNCSPALLLSQHEIIGWCNEIFFWKSSIYLWPPVVTTYHRLRRGTAPGLGLETVTADCAYVRTGCLSEKNNCFYIIV